MPFYVLTPDYNREARRRIVITSITEEEELALDSGQEITIIRGDVPFIVNPKIVEYYGIIDFNDDSDDMNVIATTSNWFNNVTTCGMWLPSNYNFKEHCALSDLDIPRVYDTYKPEVVAQYGYACIGKPERCAIFKKWWL